MIAEDPSGIIIKQVRELASETHLLARLLESVEVGRPLSLPYIVTFHWTRIASTFAAVERAILEVTRNTKP